MIISPLYEHSSEETAYLVTDYPYGGLRCKIKFWIEYRKNHGFRFVSRTENPKNGRWNNPKNGTYSHVAMAMFLDEKNHVDHTSLTEYCEPGEALEFVNNFPMVDLSVLKDFAKGKTILAQALGEGKLESRFGKKTEQEKQNALLKAEEWRKVSAAIENANKQEA